MSSITLLYSQSMSCILLLGAGSLYRFSDPSFCRIMCALNGVDWFVLVFVVLLDAEFMRD